MFLKSMICTQGFLYWIWGMLKNTNFLGGRERRTARYEVGATLRGRTPAPAPRSPRPLARLPRRVVVHGHNLHGALENDVALAEVLQRPPHGEAALHRHGAGPGPAPPAQPDGSAGKRRPAPSRSCAEGRGRAGTEPSHWAARPSPVRPAAGRGRCRQPAARGAFRSWRQFSWARGRGKAPGSEHAPPRPAFEPPQRRATAPRQGQPPLLGDVFLGGTEV